MSTSPSGNVVSESPNTVSNNTASTAMSNNNVSKCLTLYPKTIPRPTVPRTDLEKRCMGVDLTLEQTKEVWANIGGDITTSCNAEFNRLIYGTIEGKRQYSEVGFEQVMEDMEFLLSSYFNKTPDSSGKGGHTIGVPGQDGYDSFQDTLIDACTNPDYGNQGICQQAVSKMCKTCSRSDVPKNSALLRLCGCQVQPLDPKEYPGITRECDPLCSQALVSKQRDVTSGVVKECESSICVINNISIQASKSTIGGINFTQVCPQCSGSQSCKCIVDTTIASTAESVGIGDSYSFRQYCGTNSVCLTVDNQTGTVTTVPCQNAIKPLQPKTFFFPVSGWVWIVAVVVIFIGFLALISTIYDSHHRSVVVKHRDDGIMR